MILSKKCKFCKKENRLKLVPLKDDGTNKVSCLVCKRKMKRQLKELIIKWNEKEINQKEFKELKNLIELLIIKKD